jgi:hypothetical protein
MVVGRGHFAVSSGAWDGVHGQGVHCRVLDVSTRVLGFGGFCRHEVVGGDGGESDPKTLRRGASKVGWSRADPFSVRGYSYRFKFFGIQVFF